LSWFSRDPGRQLTPGERELAAGIFSTAIDLNAVRLHRARWFPFQPRNVVMAPDGGVWFHPQGGLWRDDFAVAPEWLQTLIIHELTHVWQHQRGLCLPLRRHPFCRYDYTITPERPLARYGIEQQAMIVEDVFRCRLRGERNERLEQVIEQAGFAACGQLN
jgi:hypothetical protein